MNDVHIPSHAEIQRAIEAARVERARAIRSGLGSIGRAAMRVFRPVGRIADLRH
ncbi:hypothetical protein HKCCE3408_10215 [Rhodobacterales bacterium HKCCE3408]|nr:hypothetical protein [Rhodobacterales bacterium HKCCE3408]